MTSCPKISFDFLSETGMSKRVYPTHDSQSEEDPLTSNTPIYNKSKVQKVQKGRDRGVLEDKQLNKTTKPSTKPKKKVLDSGVLGSEISEQKKEKVSAKARGKRVVEPITQQPDDSFNLEEDSVVVIPTRPKPIKKQIPKNHYFVESENDRQSESEVERDVVESDNDMKVQRASSSKDVVKQHKTSSKSAQSKVVQNSPERNEDKPQSKRSKVVQKTAAPKTNQLSESEDDHIPEKQPLRSKLIKKAATQKTKHISSESNDEDVVMKQPVRSKAIQKTIAPITNHMPGSDEESDVQGQLMKSKVIQKTASPRIEQTLESEQQRSAQHVTNASVLSHNVIQKPAIERILEFDKTLNTYAENKYTFSSRQPSTDDATQFTTMSRQSSQGNDVQAFAHLVELNKTYAQKLEQVKAFVNLSRWNFLLKS
jgi:hypothetical protein